MKKASALLMVTGALVIANIVTGVLYVSERGNSPERALSQYPFIDPARNLIAQEHYLTTLQPLREELNVIAARESEQGNEIAIYIEYLNTGANISINQNTRVLPASLTKLPLALTVMKKVEDSEWRFADQLVLIPGDANSGSGELYKRAPGTRFTIEELLQALLRDSDNTAFSIFSRNIEPEEHLATHEALGLADLFDTEGKLSAKEYSRLFRSLYTASFLNRAHSQKVLEWLDESTFNEFLASGIPEGVSFPHKFGLNVKNRVYLDSGIVYVPNRPYLITIMIRRTGIGRNPFDRGESARIMKEIAEKTYAYVVAQ